MGNLVVRGYNESGSFVTRGFGPQDGNVFLKTIGGAITMVGNLATLFIQGGGGAALTQGGIKIDIDLGIG